MESLDLKNGDEKPVKHRLSGLRPPWQKGQPSPNPAGRPKGSRSKLAEDFVADFYDAWKRKGRTALDQMAEEDPSGFVRAAVQLMPRQVEADINIRPYLVVPHKAPADALNGDDSKLIDLCPETGPEDLT